MERTKYSTFYLFKSKTSTLAGMGTVLNIGGNYFDYNYFKTALEADSQALKNDWGIVGQDLAKAISKFEKELKKVKSKQLELNF